MVVSVWCVHLTQLIHTEGFMAINSHSGSECYVCGSKTRGLSTLRVQRIRDLTREVRGPPFNYYGGEGAGVF